MDNRRNYYRILHIQPDAPAALIQSSYRTLMTSLNHHPDRGGDHADAALINEAYATLRNADKREAYDRELLARYSKVDLSGMKQTAPPAAKPRDAEDYRPIISDFCPFCQTPFPPGSSAEPRARCHECDSPLHPAAAQQISGSDKRALDRMPRADLVRIFTDWPQQGVAARTRDLSLAGMQFVTGLQLVDNQFVKIVGDNMGAIGRVVSCRPEAATTPPSFAIGVAFVTLEFERARGTFVSHSV